MKKVKVIGLLLFVANLSLILHAQSNSCHQYNTWFLSSFAGTGAAPVFWPSSNQNLEMDQLQAQYGGAGPNCTAIFTDGGAWSGVCYSTAWTCDPPSPPVGGCSNPEACAGKPVSLANGNVSIQETDVRIPGLGGGLALTRTWNSTWPCYFICEPQVGLFGTQWRSTYEESLSVGPNGTMTYSRADGSMWSFAAVGNQNSGWSFQLIAPSNVHLVTLTEQGTTSPTWTVTFENGEQRIFSGLFGGPLSAIIDRNGNTTTLTYTNVGTAVPINVLTTVTDPAGRHLNFAYNSPVDVSVVSNVTSDSGTGINISYTYVIDYSWVLAGALGQRTVLTEVTQSDNTVLNFAYDSHLNITSVTDMNNKVLESHVFDTGGCSTGLTSSRANGVDALTLVFPNMYSYCSPGGVGYPLAP